MKIPAPSFLTTRKRQDGLVAVIVMLILLAMVLAFIIANASALSTLHHDVKRIEQRQIRRISSATAHTATNSPVASAVSK